MRWALIFAAVLLVVVAGGILHVKRRIDSIPPFPPLVQAARAGDRVAILALIDSGVDPDSAAGGLGWTPLMHAIRQRRMDSVVALIDAGADVNRTGPKGLSPLSLAAAYGYNEIVEELLRRGADPYQVNRGGLSPLDFAMLGADDIDRFTVLQCQTETVALLKQHAPGLKPRGGLFERVVLFLKPCRYPR